MKNFHLKNGTSWLLLSAPPSYLCSCFRQKTAPLSSTFILPTTTNCHLSKETYKTLNFIRQDISEI
ncbi:hypothetical protein Pcar_3258 [Syntrophotalea carbinolica DSM 2380]|uniref:Uncharacterized protein n=1 Tax=Syntrophotalea carbinolica (strain DSM 2380 / NBRC 103641 / GraBd1) TaxID=338963 RepID=Q0C6Q9_SYNC1|nr:hypothetical protein Pcar_3258 [Syntrophotalea carbinolica DSM 2380]